MFPGVDGFHWTAGRIIFLGLFFAVAATILVTIVSAGSRTARHLRTHNAADLCWKSDFAELPDSHRQCRHELSGRVISRTCDNAFDCGHCEKYSQFSVLPARGVIDNLGLHYSNDCFYHRGHTWVRPEEDGTLTIGLDELAEHIIGVPDFLDLPDIGDQVETNSTAWRMKKQGREVRVRAPIEGTVLAVGGPNEGWYLKIRPRLDMQDPRTLRHLLRGPEVHGWLLRELERLQLQLHAPNTAPSLADGGVLMPDLMRQMPEADWDTVLADTFLEA